MKKTNYILIFIFFLTINLIHAQEEKESKFNIIAYGAIGYGTVENDNEPNYNLNSNSAEVLINYRINQKYGIATGIGLNQLSGNGFNSIGNFFHQRDIIKIPLVATMDYSITDKLSFIGNFGFFTQNIANDEFRFLNDTQKDVYEGWNFGAQIGVGLIFELYDNFSAGFNYTGQSDFTKFESNTNQGISDKQKLNDLSSLGIIFRIEI